MEMIAANAKKVPTAEKEFAGYLGLVRRSHSGYAKTEAAFLDYFSPTLPTAHYVMGVSGRCGWMFTR